MMAQLYGVDVRTVNEHVSKMFSSGSGRMLLHSVSLS